MDYVEGETLARLFQRCAAAGTRIPTHVGMRIALDALAGLHAAHELKDENGEFLSVVHRDVSPQNILIGVDGSSRLIDFGVARASMRLSTTRSGHLKGKLSYMAPEQARGEHIDRRADVFAAGVMLWELLTFHRLFRGEGEAETLSRLLYAPIPGVRQIEPTVPPLLEAVTMKGLARDQAQRYASAWEFADALETAARHAKALGTTRDVAVCLASVMGSELEAQRTAVRQWLARSDPNSSLRVPASRPPPAFATPGASSVSSAVISAGSSTTSSLTAGGGSARERRRAVWTGAVAAVAVFVAVALWAKLRAHPVPAASLPAPPAATAPLPRDSAASLDAPAPPDTGVVQQQALPGVTPRFGRHTGGGRPRPAPPRQPPAAPAPAPPVPDDLSHNPYR
jgi:serine/threonine-protein kinase